MSTNEHKHNRSDHSVSRWNTKEFYVYYSCFIVVIPYMFFITYGLSQSNHPNYTTYAPLLSKGWILGRHVDNSDAQYSHFRNNIPYLTMFAAGYLCSSYLNRHYIKIAPLRFSLVLSIICVAFLHGSNTFKILTIITFNFFIGRICKGSITNPWSTWIFNLSILFLNEFYHGYKFESVFGKSFAWLDLHSGVQGGWHVLFNFTVLRLISFNMDYYWSHQTKDYIHVDTLTDRDRIQVSGDSAKDYSYLNYLAYTLYIPLIFCGPIITYNDFLSQFKISSKNISTRYIVIYAVRLAAVVLLMEVTLHFLYVVALSKSKAWVGDSPLELSMIGYFNLVIIWMKLLIPWRFFRLWSLADGIWVEENMVRCMSNNFSAQRFWKSWHRTFNRWTIRYIYVPLGGSKYMAYNIWAVFTFVALWHDINLRLLTWGWLICLFLLPEIAASKLFSEEKYGSKPYYRFVCGLGAVGNIFLMMIANLVGFSIGLDEVKNMLTQIFNTMNGFFFLLFASVCLFMAAQIMFEIRESEKRRGNPKWKM
ncbi:MBOAT, membrane-bound O-acyltransferase family-domain-containing protein [Sporodiniella umbellata]|nr:MBOAT, membrane-bound O-acyltransferase family-domain-containing protein [Sporodiniella umbellata]